VCEGSFGSYLSLVLNGWQVVVTAMALHREKSPPKYVINLTLCMIK